MLPSGENWNQTKHNNIATQLNKQYATDTSCKCFCRNYMRFQTDPERIWYGSYLTHFAITAQEYKEEHNQLVARPKPLRFASHYSIWCHETALFHLLQNLHFIASALTPWKITNQQKAIAKLGSSKMDSQVRYPHACLNRYIWRATTQSMHSTYTRHDFLECRNIAHIGIGRRRFVLGGPTAIPIANS